MSIAVSVSPTRVCALRLRIGATLLIGSLASRPSVAQAPDAPQAGTTSLTLGELLERVRAGHPSVGAANSRAAAALGARRAAGALPNPVLGLGVENASLPNHLPVPGFDREATITATLPLQFLYQRPSRVRRADAQLDAAQADASRDRQGIALQVTHAYYRTALAQVELAAATDVAAWLDSLVAYNRTRVNEGVSAGADLLRAELERDRAWTEVTMRQVGLTQARAELSAFAGDSAGTMAPTVAIPDSPLALATVRLSPGGPNVSARAAWEARSEVQSARARLAAAGAAIGTAQSMLIRDLSAMVGLKQSVGFTTLLAGLSVPVPLADRNRGEVAQARAERDAAAYDLAATTRQVRAELGAAIETARLIRARIDLLRQDQDSSNRNLPAYLARADAARRIALGAYREGAFPLLQVLDATRAWGEARSIYYQTLYAQHESVVAVLAASGQDLFTTVPPLLTPPSSGDARFGPKENRP